MSNYPLKILLLLTIFLLSACASTNIYQTINKGDDEKALKMLKKDPNYDKRNNMGFTPLHLAATKGLSKTTKLLVEKGADINAKTFYGRTPFMLALRNGHSSLAKYLLNQGTKLTSNYKDTHPILDASYTNNTDIAKAILDTGVSANRSNKKGEAGIHIATIRGHQEVIKVLLQNGADINLKTEYQWSVLHGAASTGNKELFYFSWKRSATHYCQSERLLSKSNSHHVRVPGGERKIVRQ